MENFWTIIVAGGYSHLHLHVFFAGDTQKVPAVSSSYDSHAPEEVSSQQNGHPKYLPGLYLFDSHKLPSVSYFINSLVSSASVVFLHLNVFPLGWCHVWGWTSERLLHVNGYRLHLHLEKSKRSWVFFLILENVVEIICINRCIYLSMCELWGR